MDTSVIILGLLFLALMVSPFIWVSIKRKGKYKNEIAKIKELAQAQQVELGNVAVINKLVIGLDESAGKLGWSTKENLEKDFKILSLKEYRECRLKSPLGENGYQRVALELNGKKKQVLELFQAEEGKWPEMDGHKCKEEAGKWIKKIDPFLKTS